MVRLSDITFLQNTGIRRNTPCSPEKAGYSLPDAAWRIAKFAFKQCGEIIAVAETAVVGDLGNRAVAETQHVARIEQTQAVEVIERCAAGLLFHLTMQGTQRH